MSDRSKAYSRRFDFMAKADKSDPLADAGAVVYDRRRPPADFYGHQVNRPRNIVFCKSVDTARALCAMLNAEDERQEWPKTNPGFEP